MDDLLDDIDAFLDRHGLSESAFGDRALNDRHFVRQLRAGREVRKATEAKARDFMGQLDAAAVPAPSSDNGDDLIDRGRSAAA